MTSHPGSSRYSECARYQPDGKMAIVKGLETFRGMNGMIR